MGTHEHIWLEFKNKQTIIFDEKRKCANFIRFGLYLMIEI